jgi:hypothetical protein
LCHDGAERRGQVGHLPVGPTPRSAPGSARGGTGPAGARGAIHCALEVTVDLLAITVLGIKFSGTLALEIGVVVLIVIGLVWFTTMRQRRR